MKNKIAIIILLVAGVAGAIFWKISQDGKSDKPNTAITQQQDVESPKTEVVSSQKPLSFEGVEMKKYRNPFGYEIEYPARWVAKDVTKVYGDKVLDAYEIKPREISKQEIGDPSIISQIAVITVEEKTLKSFTEEIKSGKNIFIENTSKLLPVNMNGMAGLYVPLKYPSARYYFEKNGKLYSIVFLYDSMMGISKEEALWVLSTFKIPE